MKRYILTVLAAFLLSGCAGAAIDPISAPEKVTPDGAAVVNAAEGSEASKGTASYQTEYTEKSKARAHNIKLGAEKINGIVIQPGETFSFNDVMGPAGKSSGFKKARIFVRGQDAEGYGGGICQVSSTLYNCALELGLNIVERHPHSKAVGYVPKDRDAATSYGGKDLKFENTLSKPIKITAGAADGKLNISLGV